MEQITSYLESEWVTIGPLLAKLAVAAGILLMALLTALLTALIDALETLIKPFDGLPDHAAITFQLSLARPSQAYAAFLPFKVSPAAHESRG